MEARVLVFLALTVLAAEAFLNPRYEALLPADPNGPSSKGTDFWVAFQPNVRTVINSMPLYQLLVTTDEPEPVTFTVSLNENLPEALREGFPLTKNVSYGEVVTVTLHQEMAVSSQAAGSNQLERSKAIRVRTEGGKKVSVQGFNDDVRTSDGFVALPCDAMRNDVFNRFEYLVLSGEQNPNEDDPDKSSQIIIIPCDDLTQIRMEPTQLVTLNGLTDLPVGPNTIQAGPGGSFAFVTFTANAGQTILISDDDDLSGTIIRGNKPLVVFGGHECAEIPLDVSACDHLVEQMPPGSAFGYTFFLVPLAARASGDMFRVGTLTDGTQVTVTCVTSPQDVPKALPLDRDGAIDRGGYVTFFTPRNEDNERDWKPSYCCVDSIQPVIVAQYSTGYSYDLGLRGKPNAEVGDPFMTLIPPVTQFLNNYTMRSLSGASGPFPFRYINLAIAATFFDNSVTAQNLVKINETAVSPIDGWLPMYCSNNEVCGYGAQVEVGSGTIRVYHERPEVGLGMSYYAFQQQNSYGVPEAYGLTPMSATRVILQDITVQEGVGNVTISVPRFGDLSLLSQGVLTPQPTSPEEASAGTDYVNFGPINLRYRGGQRQDDSFEFQITIIDDEIPEPTERFEISGVATKNLYFPFPVMTVTILDNEEPPSREFWFDPTLYSVNEDAGTATLTIRTNTPGPESNGAVTFYTEDGTASAPGDYTAVPQSNAIPVVFAAGESSTTVSVPITNDRSMESDETFFGRLQSTGADSVTITQDRAEITITDDDDEAATISLNPTSYVVDESDGVVNIVVEKTGVFSQPIQGTVTTVASGSARESADFTGGAYPFTIQPTEQQTTISIPITDDITVEQLQEQFSVSLSLQPQPGVTLGNSGAAVTIEDDDNIEIRLEPSSQTVAESSSATFRVVTTGQSDLPFSVLFRTVDGTATAPGDYQSSSITLTEAELSGGTYEVTVSVEDDSVLEGQETFQAQLELTQQSMDLGVVSLGQSTGDVFITDDDVVQIGFSPTLYEVDESSGVVTFFVENRNPEMEREVTVVFTTTDGNATGGSDYTATTQELTFAPGDSLQSVSVAVVDDNVYEGLEEFTAELTTTDSGVDIFQSGATARINDDDAISIQFNPTSYSVSEGGSVQLVVQKIGTADEAVTVTLSTQDGTAGSSDFTSIPNLPVTFAPDESEKRVTIQTSTDNVLEGTEQFSAVLSSPPDRVTITQDTADVSIGDTGPGSVVVEFQPSSYTVDEDEGVVRFTIVKRTLTTQDVTVQFTTVDESATSPGDYTAVSQEVTFGADETVKVVEVPIQQDSVLEGVELFTATLTPVSGPVSFQTDEATATIVDDDSVQIGFSSTLYEVEEDSGVVTFFIENRNPDLEREVTVQFTTIEGTASDGSDYIETVQELTFAPGEILQTVGVTIANDNVYEGLEEFTVELTTTDSGVEIFQPDATAQINDDDVISIEFNPTSYSVTEGGSVQLVVQKIGTADEAVTVTLSTQEGTAGSSDFTSISTFPVTFAPDESEKRVTIQTSADSVLEGTEQFSAVLSSPPDRVTITQDTADISIEETEDVVVEFQPNSYTVDEDEGVVRFTIRKITPTTQDVTVQFTTQDGSATSPGDYVTISEEVTFGADETVKVVEVPIQQDNVVESVELFTATLTPVSGSIGVRIGGQGEATATITDDDRALISFEVPKYVVFENDGPVEVCLTKSAPTTESFTVQIEARQSEPTDATGGSDFVSGAVDVVFPAGTQNRSCVEVPIIDDSEALEGVESFQLDIRPPNVPGVEVDDNPTAIVDIIDDDEVNVFIESDSYQVPEDGGPVTICVLKDQNVAESFTVQVATSNLTPVQAEAGSDYSEVETTLVFNSDQERACFDVPVLDDQLDEGTEDFRVVITNVSAGVGTGLPKTSIISIVDNDVVTVEFGSPTYTIPENGGNAIVCLTTSMGSDQPLTVTVSTAPKDNSATAGEDYVGTPQQVTIPPSASPSEVCFNIPINDDSISEQDEEFLVSFQVPSDSGALIGPLNSTCVSIIDDDVPQVEFVSPEYTVNEDDGEVDVCLMIDHTISSPVIVRLYASPITAEAGLDYVPGVTNLAAFQPPGNSVVCTSFEIIDDLLALEEDEKFVVDVGPEEGDVEFGDNNRTTVTILDDDVVVVEPSTEDRVVNENAGTVRVCLMKDKDTARPFEVDVYPHESNSTSPATAGLDFVARNRTITFGPLDREACTDVPIVSDLIVNEMPEDFEVAFSFREEDVNDMMKVSSKVLKVTIIDNGNGSVANDTVVADPLFIAPILGGGQLCYEVHGQPGRVFNLVSDKCTSVSADYEPMTVQENRNIIQAIGVRAVGANGTCHNIEVHLTSGSERIAALVDNIQVTGTVQANGVRVRRFSDRVRISVPNCEYLDLVMWVMYQEMNDQRMLKFVITRGYNLAPTSHGLIGQFWNIPVTVSNYSGPLKAEHEADFNQGNLYLITIEPATGGKSRTFLGAWHELAWDMKSGPCYYVGSSQGGRSGELDDNDPVIEGKYFDYEVDGLFGYKFAYSQFQEDRCN